MNQHWKRILAHPNLGVGLIFVLSIVIYFSGLVQHHYYVGPGNDIYVHILNTWKLQNGAPWTSLGYPPGLYYIFSLLASISHLSIIEVLTWVGPVILVLGSLAVYTLARGMLGQVVGLYCYALFVLASRQPFQTYFDGGLPNWVAAGILLPLIYLALVKLIEQPKRPLYWLLLGVSIVSLLLSHHLTVILAFPVMMLWLLVVLVYFLCLKPSWTRGISFLAGYIVLAWSLNWLFWHLTILTEARYVFLLYTGLTDHFPYIYSLGTKTCANPGSCTWDFKTIANDLGKLAFLPSLLALPALIWQWKQLKHHQRLGIMALLIWYLAYMIGAMLAMSGEPTRLERDLAIPATILSGWVIYEGIRYLRAKPSRRYFLLICLTIITILAVRVIPVKVAMFSDYSNMLRFSKADEQAYTYLQSHSRLASQTTVLTQEIAWQTVAQVEGKLGLFKAITYQYPSPGLLIEGCYLVGWYDQSVWPISYSNQSVARSYLNSPNATLVQQFIDQNKTLNLICAADLVSGE